MSVNFPIFWSDGERSGLIVFASIYSGGCLFINVNTYKHSYSNLSSFVKRKTKFLKFFGHLYTSKVVATKNVHLRLYNVVCAGMYLLCRLLAEHILHRRHCLYSIFERVGSRHPPLHTKRPARDSRQVETDRQPLLSQGQVNPASDAGRVTPGSSKGWRGVLQAKLGALAVTVTSFL